MTTITPENGSNPAYSCRSYSGLSNKLVKAANSVDYAYRDTGPAAGDGVPLVLLQHFRGNLDNWDPALIDALSSARRVVTFDNAGVGRLHWHRPGHHRSRWRAMPPRFSPPWSSARLTCSGFSIGSFIAQQIALVRRSIVTQAGSGVPRRRRVRRACTAGRRRSSARRHPLQAERRTLMFSSRNRRGIRDGERARKRCSACMPGPRTGTRQRRGPTREARCIVEVYSWGIPNHALLQRLSRHRLCRCSWRTATATR